MKKEKPVVTDITPLFLWDTPLTHHGNKYVLWYRYDIIDEEVIIEGDLDELGDNIDEQLNHDIFPDYKYIMYAAINFIEENELLYDESSENELFGDGSFKFINVVVDERSKYAKDHPSDGEGFVRLFTLIFDKEKEVKIMINGKLVVEKFELTDGTKTYPVTPATDDQVTDDHDDQDGQTDSLIACPICMQTDGELVTTFCNHKFHLQCLRCVPKLKCPLCRECVIDFLKANGISADEIETRLKDQANEIELENLCGVIDDEFIKSLNDISFIKVCMETLKLNGGNVLLYFDIIFDMNADASQLFARISFIKSKKAKGVFAYMYDSPVDLILQMFDPNSASRVEWVEQTVFKDTSLADIIDNRLGRIVDFQKEYVVVVIIDNVVNAHIVSADAYNTARAYRYEQRDILNSLLKCIRCRCSGNTADTPNREYDWAKKLLGKYKNNNKKKNNKRRKRKN